jgi:hypothetical protein
LRRPEVLEITIGVTDNPKEITLQVDEGAQALADRVDEALKGGGATLWFTDQKGKMVGIPTARLAFIEMDPTTHTRSVGFKP